MKKREHKADLLKANARKAKGKRNIRFLEHANSFVFDELLTRGDSLGIPRDVMEERLRHVFGGGALS